MILIYSAQICIYLIGGKSIFGAYGNGVAPEISVGMTTQAVTYIIMICSSLVFFAMIFSSIARGVASAKRINEVLDEEIDFKKNEEIYKECTFNNLLDIGKFFTLS